MGAPRVEIVEGTRKCSKCGEWKSLESDFYWDGTDQRYRSSCKVCVRERSRRRHAQKRDFILEQQRERRRVQRAQLIDRDRKRLERIKNHKDPELVPWGEWRSSLLKFKNKSNYKWEEIEDYLGVPRWTIQNQCHGKVWPPTIEEAKKIQSKLESMPSRRIPLDEWTEIIEEVRARKRCSYREIDRMLGWPLGRVKDQLRGNPKRPAPLRSELPELLDKLGLDKKGRVSLSAWQKAVYRIASSKGLSVPRIEGLFGLPDGVLAKQLKGEALPPLLEDAEWMLRRAAGLPVSPKPSLDKQNIYMPDGSVYVRFIAT